ncbi:hypothetical protein I316_00990 [Kwoniella heveanensis BCC8398]|uniref:Uncharacterized protein n=1 Tax=Kwoniella heveanensis BCC8398 TaxID=1296120 RepID=A0A1B9H1D6_9TREE|nr:hypothetical protein I316_00990 [Kwoniella heveanensis BCC8398]
MIRFARYMGNASLEESQEIYRAHTRPEGSADMPSYQGYLPETYIGRRPPDTSTQTQQPTSGGGAAASHTFNTIPQHIWNHWHGWQTSAGLPEDAASANILNAYQTAFQHTGDPDCGSHPSIGPSITHAAHQWLNAQAAQAAQTAPLGASAAQVQAAPQGFSGKHVYGSLDHTDFDYDDDEAEDFD